MKKLQMLTVQEVCSLLKVNRHTLYEWINAKDIIAFKHGKNYRITEQALEDFITKNQVA